MAYKKKTKAERQQWWNSLTLDEQTAQIEKWKLKKQNKRNNYLVYNIEPEDQAHIDGIREEINEQRLQNLQT